MAKLNLFGNGMIGNVKVNWSGSTRTDERYYYVNDHLGTPRLVLDEHSNISSGKDYYAYGKTLREINNGTEQKYDYTSKELDKETGLHYYGARYYDSDISNRWLSVDPLADKYPGWSPYNYVRNNPLRLVDPNGMNDEDVNKDGDKKDNILVFGFNFVGTAVVGGNAEIFMAYKMNTGTLSFGVKGGKSFGTTYLSAGAEFSYYPNMSFKELKGENSRFSDKFKDNKNPKEYELSGTLLGGTLDVDNNGKIVGGGIQGGAETPGFAVNSTDFNFMTPELKAPQTLPIERKTQGLIDLFKLIFE